MNSSPPLRQLFSWFTFFFLTAAAASASELPITDFNVKPNSRRNATPAVRQVLEACRTLDHPTLVFPPGRYDFWPHGCVEKHYFESNTTDNNPKRLGIFIERLTNLTVNASGATFVFHDRMQPFTVDQSENVTIQNCRIDWEIPLSAEAIVAATNSDYLDLKIDDRQFPYVIESGKLVFVGEGWKSRWWGTMEFDGETLQVVPQTGDAGCLGSRSEQYQAEALQPGLVRLRHRFTRLPGLGNVLVLRHNERDHAGLFVTDSKNVAVENVDLFHCAGLGLLAQFSENLTVRDLRVVPSPARKVLSGHDDGVHVSNCRGLVQIEHCRFHGLMDDPINVHGTSVRIIERPAPNRLRCKFMHDQSTGMTWGRPGDRIGFLENESMRTLAQGRCAEYRTLDRDTFEVTFEQAVPQEIEVGDALENLTWSPDVIIRNCHFASNRARGVLISTPGRVVIEGNRFESSGSAILIAGDANQWYESGAVTDVLIQHNVFESPCLTSMYQFCEGLISIYPEIPRLDPAHPFHRNIRIQENEFHPFDYPVLYAKSVDSLTFSQNRLIRSHDFTAFHPRKATLTFEACRGIQIDANKFEGEILGKNIVLQQTPASEVQVGPGQDWIR